MDTLGGLVLGLLGFKFFKSIGHLQSFSINWPDEYWKKFNIWPTLVYINVGQLMKNHSVRLIIDKTFVYQPNYW
jgi:hypothetical protein